MLVMFSSPMCYDSIANLKSCRKRVYCMSKHKYCRVNKFSHSMHREEWSKRDFGGDYQPATGEAEQITQTRHGA